MVCDAASRLFMECCIQGDGAVVCMLLDIPINVVLSHCLLPCLHQLAEKWRSSQITFWSMGRVGNETLRAVCNKVSKNKNVSEHE
jgi:hypothetical protein